VPKSVDILKSCNDISVVRTNSQNNAHDWDSRPRPSFEALAELQFAYDFFNKSLFDARLCDCILVHTRKKRVLGHFAPDRFQRVGGNLLPELALNPTFLALRDDRDSLSTLVHEQAHVFRHYFGPLNRKGKRSTTGYHDLPWVAVMERIGLIPSNTGEPGGKKTGYQMTHYIEENGPFDQACQVLLDRGFQINWVGRIAPNKNTDPTIKAPLTPTKKDRIRFSCPECALNAWAKPSAKLACGTCGLIMNPSH